jgi:hypothetical protein
MIDDSNEKGTEIMTLVEHCLPRKTPLYYMCFSRLSAYIRILREELLSSSESSLTKSLTQQALGSLIDNDLVYLVGNEIILNLIIGYKQGDCQHKGGEDLVRLTKLTYQKYFTFINHKIGNFYETLPTFSKRLQREKWKMKKVKRIPSNLAPTVITVDVRFAIIKRANRKCENCGSSIFDNPIEVFQLKDDGQIRLVAYCKKCRKNKY